MNPERWRRVVELFHRALEIPDEAARKRLIGESCAGDDSLRTEVLSLLDAHRAGTGFLEEGPGSALGRLLDDPPEDRWVGRQVGNWTIEHLIHFGGMGAVYRVRRTSGEYRQTAALKLIRFGLETPELIERFARERQLLAQLDHPGIARLLDGGTTDGGLPYLVMELVDGMPIDQYCDERRLGIHERIELFESVCAIVHHAHQQLVIHRDLKPSNILVTDAGLPKLLDFGIAKLLSDQGAAGEVTRTQQRMLTPSISSPEQFSGGAASTATDVYALGVLLYRLLSGSPPYRVGSDTSIAEVERLICRETPIRPSQQLNDPELTAAIAEQRGLAPDRLRRRLRGDLDTIVMKALRKEPKRRYSSVEALARDLERHRQGLPVSARPDSVGYRATKFISRHWIGLSATAGAFAALAIGLAVALWQAEQARTERDRTLRINEFLQTILVEADPYEAGADTTVRDVLRKAGDLVGERFGDQPDLEAPLRYTIGYTQLGLMELDASEANLRRADQLNLTLYGSDDERSLRTRAYLAWIEFRRGRYAEADQGYQDVIARLDASHSAEFRATVINDYGVVLSEQERYEEAAEMHRRSLDLWLAHEPERPEVSVAYNNIAYAWHGQGDLEKAETWYRRALERNRSASPDGDDPNLAYNLNNLGILLRDLGRLDEALPLYEESLEIRRRTLGPEHAFTGFGHLNLGRLLLELNRSDEAHVHLEQALRISRSTLDENQLQTLVARASLARAKSLAGSRSEAASELEQVVVSMREAQVPDQFLEQAMEWLNENAGSVAR